jgi:hypothetical protein
MNSVTEPQVYSLPPQSRLFEKHLYSKNEVFLRGNSVNVQSHQAIGQT